jgi:hypothetical protein
MARLEDDLETGAWSRRYGDALGTRDSLDLGYRLVVAGGRAPR